MMHWLVDGLRHYEQSCRLVEYKRIKTNINTYDKAYNTMDA